MEGTEREGPQVTVEPGPLRALLRHCASVLVSHKTNQHSNENINIRPGGVDPGGWGS